MNISFKQPKLLLSHKILQHKTVMFYVITAIFKSISEFIAIFFIADNVTPKDLGIWTIMLTFSTYANFFSGGIVNGLNRELPYLLSQGKTNLAKSMISSSQFYIVGCSVLTLVIGAVVSGYYLYYGFLDKGYVFLSVTIITIINFYNSYLQATYRSNAHFNKLSFIQTVYALASIFSVALIYFYGFYGMMLRLLFVQFLFVVLLHIYRPFVEPFRWNKKVVFLLMRTGLPIFIMAYVHSIALTSDRWIVNYYADELTLGIYSFGLYAFSALLILINAIGSFLYPKFTFQYGSNNSNKATMWLLYKKTTKYLVVIFTAIPIVLYFFIPFVVKNYFHNYLPVIQTMQILVFAGGLYGWSLGANILWSMKAWKYMASQQLSNALLLILCPLLFVRYFEPLQGVALGVCIAYFLNFFITTFLVKKATI